MRVTVEQRHYAGAELWRIAQGYKELRSDLDDKEAFRLAILGNPDVAETYLGQPVRRDAVEDVKKYVMKIRQYSASK